MASWFYWREEILFLNIQLQPGARKDEIVGPQGDYLKIRIAALPIEGRANKSLIKFLAKTFKVPQAKVSVLRGEQSRLKTIRIENPKDLNSLPP